MKNYILTLVAASALSPTLVVSQSITPCESGSIEGDSGVCSTAFSGACSLEPITNLETINEPSLLEGQVGGNGQLTLQVRHDLTADRRVDAIVLDEATAACNY